MSLVAAAFYGLCSGSMSFVNKLAMNTYKFEYPAIIMLAQLSVTAIILKLVHLAGRVNLPPYNKEMAKLCFFPSLFYVLNSTFALSALSGMNIPMYNVLKRTGPLFYIFLAVCLLKKGWPSLSVICAVVVTSGGCVIAGLGDLSFDLKAYLFGIISIFLQGIYLTLVQKLGIKDEMTTNGILYINSLNCIPFLVVYSLLTSELLEAVIFFRTATLEFCGIFTLVISAGCVLNYAQFLCTTLNSALTTSIVGVLKSVVTTFIGMFTFGGIPLTTFTVLGISLNTIGAIWYTFAKYQESVISKLQKAAMELPMHTKQNGHVMNGNVMNGQIKHQDEVEK